MSNISDREYLLAAQYRDASNLNARIQLHERFSLNRYGWHRWIFDQFQVASESRILELGCGPGALWAPNLDHVLPGWAVTLSDFSPGMVQAARQTLQAGRCHFRYAVVDAQALPFEDASHDAVIANHMLYHVPNRSRALAEMRRILKPGGRFYASTIGKTHMRELDDLVCRFAGRPDSVDESLYEGFALENGLDQLAQWFSGVALRRYEDGLVITEAAPLVAYILSSNTWWSAAIHANTAELTRFVEQELAAHGAIRVTKDAGLFTALRDNAP